MSESRSEKLRTFTEWAGKHITGDEKGQAQIFLDRLFQAFGHAGSLDVGGEPEFRVRKESESGGGTAFADYVWKPVVLFEMKKRGTPLSKHYRQAFDYWTRLVPGRPRYVVLCNFDEFHVYDFETQMDTPVGRTKLADLPDHYGPLAFLFPGQPKPVFDNEHVAVTREASAKLAKCFNKLTKRGIDRDLAQRFVLQTLVALFSEDIGLMEKYSVTRLLEDVDESNSFDLLGGLFRAMNNRNGNSGGRFKDVPYFNGGVFSNPAELELTGPEIILLRECATFDWSKVQPEIFGTVFEQTLGKDERHAQGAHFTHPADIMKIIGPTVVEPLRAQIERANLKQLMALLHRLHEIRVLDPACGSGNFLYICYRELKRLEARIFERINQEFPSRAAPEQIPMSYLSARNFYGIDRNAFAVELAKVTMMIARKLAIDELHISENALPLDNLDNNFRAADALVTIGADGKACRTPWPPADIIVSNPPFLGAKLLKKELGPDYVNTLRHLYPEIPGMADLCVYWFRRAHDHLSPCTEEDPLTGRAGLVGTQNVRNNAAREGGLDRIVEDGTIIEAVDNQPWSGDANVHVSIANWVKTKEPKLLPKKRHLWFKVEPSAARKAQWKADGKKLAKEYDLDFREAAQINSTLSDKTDVSEAAILSCNTDPQKVFQGITPGHAAFVLTSSERAALIRADAASSDIIHPYLIGDEILSDSGKPERFVLDFEQRDILAAQQYKAAFDHVEKTVLPARQKAAEDGKDQQGKMRPHHKRFLDRWWKLSWDRADLINSTKQISRYLVCSRVTKRPVFVFVSSLIRPGDALQAFIFDDDYSFGILQSSAHWTWFVTKCSKLAERFRYTPESVFDTFPWPQSPTEKDVKAVAEAARELRSVRASALSKMNGGLRELYRTMELPGANPLKDAHASLDAAVLAAYGFTAKDDILSALFGLNQQVEKDLASGSTVTPPGVPPGTKSATDLISADCVEP